MKDVIINMLIVIIIVGGITLLGWWGIGPKVVIGCCQVGATKCASGQGVTREYCVQELDGEFFSDKICNTDIGQCE